MKISYNWLKEFIPAIPPPVQLSNILTSVGLEVEDLTETEQIKGSLAGLVTGEVVACEKHPGADVLKITRVDVKGEILQIVCGASNVAIGQKVVVAPIGSVIYPLHNEPVTIKKAKIRGVDSYGMICAEDEIGIGSNHEGIVVLPGNSEPGRKVADYFDLQNDWIFEIGLTPNRIDAMSHLGVAKDIAAYLSHHQKAQVTVQAPFTDKFQYDTNSHPVKVVIENSTACERYAGVSLSNIRVRPSPPWMQRRLESVGVRPINIIVDITNYLLHETGQPLHAFDADAIEENEIRVKNLPQGTSFITLDGKERKLDATDLMICNGSDEPMCIGGVFGGLRSGVKDSTSNIFLEAAWFSPSSIRRTSVRHGLRTDAAARFEKGVDISQTVTVLKRAAKMIKDLAGGDISSEIIDVYPYPRPRTAITLQDSYLKKISGVQYDRKLVRDILSSLGFGIEKEEPASLHVTVPQSKPDINLPADLVEEIMRIDGYDNVEIPPRITISPSARRDGVKAGCKEKTSGYLIGAGFSEIFTNSLTSSAYYGNTVLQNAVKIINSLSAGLDIMRPSLLESGLECVTYNVNRKNNDLLLFEFGNSYAMAGKGNYIETEHLCLYACDGKTKPGWKEKAVKKDFYFIKGICENIFALCGLPAVKYEKIEDNRFEYALNASIDGQLICVAGMVRKNLLDRFSIKEEVLFADLNWEAVIRFCSKNVIEYKEIPKFPSVNRDLSVVLSKDIPYKQIEDLIHGLKISQLKEVRLFDVFESEKLGIDKKALAISFTFTDIEKTLTDREIEVMMNAVTSAFESRLNAEIRK